MRYGMILTAAACVALGFGCSRSDSHFVEDAASGGMLEVQLGRYAADHASNESVRQFGQHMVEDHGQANQELIDVARKEGLSVPNELLPAHQRMLERLVSLQGVDFDREYMKSMVRDHEEDVAAFRSKAKDGKTGVDLFAAKTLPTLEGHLQMARDVENHLGDVAAAPSPR